MRPNAHQSDNNTVFTRNLKELNYLYIANAPNKRFSSYKQGSVYKQGIPQNFQSSEIYDLWKSGKRTTSGNSALPSWNFWSSPCCVSFLSMSPPSIIILFARYLSSFASSRDFRFLHTFDSSPFFSVAFIDFCLLLSDVAGAFSNTTGFPVQFVTSCIMCTKILNSVCFQFSLVVFWETYTVCISKCWSRCIKLAHRAKLNLSCVACLEERIDRLVFRNE